MVPAEPIRPVGCDPDLLDTSDDSPAIGIESLPVVVEYKLGARPPSPVAPGDYAVLFASRTDRLATRELWKLVEAPL